MEKYKVSSIEELTPELIQSLIQRFKMKELSRLKRLQEYYDGQTDIKKRTMSDPAKPNHRVSTSYAQYLSNTINAFFLGVPISYIGGESELMSKVQPILDLNHEQTHNSRLGKSISVTGVAYELLYVNEQTELKMAYLDPTEVFMVYDNTIEENPIAAIRFYKVADYLTDETKVHVELYTKEFVQIYVQEEDDLKPVDEPKPHYLNEVPVNFYRNNDEKSGDFEKVIDLINAYELSLSDQANSYSYFSDAYMVITGGDMDEKDFKKLKEQKLLGLPQGATADFLVKTTDYQSMKEYQAQLKSDIHSLSFTPDLNSETFGNNSGESLKYRLFGLESYVSIKEAMFRKSLEKRLQIITNYLNLRGNAFDYNDITMAFTRNLPPHLESIAKLIKELDGVVSRKNLLQLLPFLDDIAADQLMLAQEQEGSLYPNFPEETQV